MDIEGLDTIIRNNHEEYLRQFKDIKGCIDGKIGTLNVRVKDAESEIKKHDRSIVRIKTIGTVIGAMWTAFLYLFR